ncbi:MAG: response regulator transcription factor [Muribaculaceae bacterium]|nr:response regulator transcription factor [Muribaculaceae bacterium]
MIRCIAIDDEPLALKQISKYISQMPDLELAGSCQSALEAQELLAGGDIDAMFIDINMPDLNGLDFVRSLEQPPMVVFTTAYAEYALEGYKVNAVDYLLKPFGLDDMKNTADKLKKQYDLINSAMVSGVDDDNAIYIKTDYKIVRIEISSIRYIEAMSEYLRIYTEDSPKALVALLSMKKMDEHLKNHKFMRIHRSYIINLRKIKEVNRSHVSLDADTSLPIGDMYKEAFNAYISSKFLTK